MDFKLNLPENLNLPKDFPCSICIVDAVCTEGCDHLTSYLIRIDYHINRCNILDNIPKNRRIANRIGKILAYMVSNKLCDLLQSHFGEYFLP
ncbi:MAG: hypothetical protein ACFFG0_00155 [Candidatus Thorarchaeota archaeon]